MANNIYRFTVTYRKIKDYKPPIKKKNDEYDYLLYLGPASRHDYAVAKFTNLGWGYCFAQIDRYNNLRLMFYKKKII
jgi:hypothetical protein